MVIEIIMHETFTINKEYEEIWCQIQSANNLSRSFFVITFWVQHLFEYKITASAYGIEYI